MDVAKIDYLGTLLPWNRTGELRDVDLYTEQFEVGDQYRLYVQFRDVTAENRAKERAAESAEYFTRAFEANPIPNLISSLESSETFGYSREELQGKSTADTSLWPDPENRGALV